MVLMGEGVGVEGKEVAAVSINVGDLPQFRKKVHMCRYVKEDRAWARAGVVATVVNGEPVLPLQQRVEDVRFHNFIVTPMGGDRVFLHCLDQVDVLQVFNDTVDFFGMLFSNVHKWSAKDVVYEHGTWLRLYGILIHA